METTRTAKKQEQMNATILAVSKRFGMYKDEKKKEVKKADIKEDHVLKELKRIWYLWKFPNEFSYELVGDLEKYYKLVLNSLHGLKTLKCTPEDVERFSIALADFQEEEDFSKKAGVFLSVVINWARGMDYTIQTEHLEEPIDYIGFKNLKNITVKGNVGENVGAIMLRGSITVEGNAGDWIAPNIVGGKIVIKGDAGKFIAESTTGGEIHLEGKYGDISSEGKGVKIYHKGELIQ